MRSRQLVLLGPQRVVELTNLVIEFGRKLSLLDYFLQRPFVRIVIQQRSVMLPHQPGVQHSFGIVIKARVLGLKLGV